MKLVSATLILLSICFVASSQDLPLNSAGFVYIGDSIKTNGKSLQEVKSIMSKWAHSLLDQAHISRVYNLNNSKQTESVSINLPLGSILTHEQGNNKFVSNGTLVYTKTKKVAFTPVVTFGAVKFSLSYYLTRSLIVYDFVNLEYSHDMQHYGKFEEEKGPKDAYNNSLLLKMSKKEWSSVKIEYYNYLKILARNLNDYLQVSFSNTNEVATNAGINYDCYKKIIIGMSYEEVIKILGEEGKETTNGSTKLEGKTVSQQAFIWKALDHSKSISIIFIDGKVSAKSQSNL
ncbi:hypothetical protein [Paraflavitalea pollutisoli]|uniref:hypothetical protein n=1 Tax=Paraflavitalea pollutisoli TaxID=3034143 RepID=UPI0023EB003E|nr:hypothetical protein [Paraflavitalea sp. H1-2-19X]